MGGHSGIPAVMCFAGLDPTGGAGLQADIETIASLGGHALPVITAITMQDTRDVKGVVAVDPLDVIEQARVVLDDIPVAAFKLGLLGSTQITEAIHTILADYPQIPVIVDPICASGAGCPLVDEEQLNGLVSLIFPQTTIATPNSSEARLLAPEADSLGATAQQIMSYGCDYVLVTGSHEPGPEVIHRLYGDMRFIKSYNWPRLPDSYHGSGCTLAAAIAALVAQGFDLAAAVAQAQLYTWETLSRAFDLGKGQRLPNRIHWTKETHSH